jgi:flagellin-like hook-associated protein FlgL
MTRLSTGLRINSGADDPSGMIASTELQSNITSINAAVSNSQLAEQMIATADSGLGQVSSLLNSIQGLVTSAANTGTLSSDQIAADQLQIDSSLSAINQIAQSTKFQGQNLLNGSLGFNIAKGTAANDSNISSVQINQANLSNVGANGLGVNVSVTSKATQAELQAGIPVTNANGTAANATITFASGGGFVLQAASHGTADNGVKVVFNDVQGLGTTPNANYNQGTNTININVDATQQTSAAAIASAITTGTNGAFTTSGVNAGNYDPTVDSPTNVAATTAAATVRTNNGGILKLNVNSTGTPALAGANGNNVNVNFVQADLSATNYVPTAAYAGGTLTVTVDSNKATSLTAIANAINDSTNDPTAAAAFSAQVTGQGVYNPAVDNPNANQSIALVNPSGGVGDTLTFTDKFTNQDSNAKIQLATQNNLGAANPTSVWNGTTHTLTITVDSKAPTTEAAIINAVNTGTTLAGGATYNPFTVATSGSTPSTSVLTPAIAAQFTQSNALDHTAAFAPTTALANHAAQFATSAALADTGNSTLTFTASNVSGANPTIKFVTADLTSTSGTPTAVWDPTGKQLTITVNSAATTALSKIETAVNNAATGAGGSGITLTTSTDTAGLNTSTGTFDGTSTADINTITNSNPQGTLAATTAGVNTTLAFGVTNASKAGTSPSIKFVTADLSGSSYTPTAVWSAGSHQLTVTVDKNTLTSVSAIETAVNAQTGTSGVKLTASTDTTGNDSTGLFDPGTITGDTNNDIAAIQTGTTAGVVNVASVGDATGTKLTFTPTAGISGGNPTVKFVTTAPANLANHAPTASWNGSQLTITVDNSQSTSVAAIETAVNGLTGKPFTLTTNTDTSSGVGSTGTFDPGTIAGDSANSITAVTGGGNTLAATVAGQGGNIPVNLSVNPPAAGVDVATSGGGNAVTGLDTTLENGTPDTGGLADNVTFQVSGNAGTQVYSFQIGTTVAQMVTAISADTDSTGVTASQGTTNGSATPLVLTSTGYGSSNNVKVTVISDTDAAGNTATNFSGALQNAAGAAATSANGTDVVGTINGIAASGSGNTLSVNNADLSMSATVKANSTGSMNFNITSGGALFQLGADVVSSQQARLGIQSVDTSSLGGSAGLLYTLGSGGAASLANNPSLAASIVTQATSQVADLRGRLGAFQSTTLESNVSSLNDTLQNLTSAQSSIQDANFATESANLTRAQVLVQSGVAVLSVANKSPQTILSLLQGL